MELELDNLPVQSTEEDELSDQELSNINALSVSFKETLLKTAAGYLGVNRANNLPQIESFLELFGLHAKENGKFVPFCAAGLSYAACKTYCLLHGVHFEQNPVETFKSYMEHVHKSYFMPSASCGLIMQDAEKTGRWIPKGHKEPQRGDLVLYNWKGGAWPDHIGIIEQCSPESLHTIEFNTSSANNINGGAVNRRVRNYNCVLGFVRFND